jgi:hypothetical protein
MRGEAIFAPKGGIALRRRGFEHEPGHPSSCRPSNGSRVTIGRFEAFSTWTAVGQPRDNGTAGRPATSPGVARVRSSRVRQPPTEPLPVARDGPAEALPAPLTGEAGNPWAVSGSQVAQAAGSPSKPLFYPRSMKQAMAFMLREQEVAARLRVSVSTLRRMRERGTGPEWVRIGKQIRYPIGGARESDTLIRWPPTPENPTQERHDG